MADLISASKQFSNKTINIRLDEKNFVTWRHQVQLMVIGNGLESYIDGTPPPPEFVVADDGTRSKNPAFAEHRQVDAALASWLLSTVSEKFLTSLSKCNSSRAIWTSLKPPSSTTRVMRLLTSLHSQRKGNLSMREYIDNIQTLCDSLASAGSEHSISELVHICVILGGLGSEYESSVSVITGSMVPFDLEATINLLLDAELRLQDAVAPLNLDSVALNVSVADRRPYNGPPIDSSLGRSPPGGRSNSDPRSSAYQQPNIPPPSQSQFYPPQQHFYRPGQNTGQGRGRGYFQGRTQCQLCGRFGHLVARCYRRHDKSFPGIGARGGPPPPIGANSAEFYDSDDQAFYAASADYYSSSPPHHSAGSHHGSSSSSGSTNSAWYPDSGATNHLTNNSGSMTHSAPYKGTGPRHGGGSAGGR